MSSPDRPRYISVSRRTDIPRFFSRHFYHCWRKGEITYDGGYGRSFTVSLRRADVLGYIFWSKDFAPFIAHPGFRELMGAHNAVFHFTINESRELEPHVAPLHERLATLERLCELVGPERIIWRFDPLCRYRRHDGRTATNHHAFFSILPAMEKLGIRRCVFSFMTMYKKLAGRQVLFLPFAEPEKREIAGAMLRAARQAGMMLFNCCNSEVPALVPGIEKARCVDAELLAQTDRFGIHRPLAGKPTRPGCGCHESRDIGSYRQQCLHACRYCYANPR